MNKDLFKPHQDSRLTVLGNTGRKAPNGHRLILCVCICGTQIEVGAGHLRNGNTKSCGCLRKEITAARMLRHGHYRGGRATPTKVVHEHIMQRCYNPKDKSYNDYGGRGITVCERWHKFENFLEDMGECPPGLMLERKDNNGNYCPENCVWATRTEQNRNTRSNKILTVKGESKPMSVWAEERRINYSTLRARIRRGTSHEKAIGEK